LGGIIFGLGFFIHINSSIGDRQERQVQENTRISSADAVAGSRAPPITVAVKIAIPHLIIVLPFFQFIMISAACLKTERERQRLSLSRLRHFTMVLRTMTLDCH